MKDKILNFALSSELYNKLSQEANENERNISAQIRYIINQYFKYKNTAVEAPSTKTDLGS